MTLTTGSRIGPYEIKSPLGEGGMGVVFRALDTKLHREVALKLLPDHFANDTDRLSRFQREAQVLASLNHPNIAQIYGLEDSASQRCIVMELVEGDTLADRLKRGPIPVDEALPIAVQIAAALEAAHEKSIIHRDLKPANIKLAPGGQVKVLDFGLAKAFENTDRQDLSSSPTLSLAATNAGMILGTAAYMSPEQTRGIEVDRRTDIFAFGCVLYEMLTGRQAFQGETVSDILATILKTEPDWSRLPEQTPASVRRLLRRCLQKDRSRRMKYAEDVRIEIEEARAEPERMDAPIISRSRERLAWAVAVLVLFSVAVTLAILHLRAFPEAPEMRVDIVSPSTPDPMSFAISPDGQRVVFVASGDGPSRLWLRPLAAGTAQPLAGTEGASYPFWSPDSRSVAFFAASRLKRLDIGGGLPWELANAPTGRGGTWGPDGALLFAPSNFGALFRVPAFGGEPVAVTRTDSVQFSHRFPQFLPGGRQFLFYANGTEEGRGIYIGSLDSPETTRLMSADTAGAYVRSGWLVFLRQGTLLARRFDPARRKLSGEAVTVADFVPFDAPVGIGAFSVSPTVVAYRSGGPGRRQLTWFDRAGKAVGTLGAPDESGLQEVSLSPEGRRVAVQRTVQSNTDIWILDAAHQIRLTSDPSLDMYPVWSPDGSRIVFGTFRKGPQDIYVKPSGSAGSEDPLVESPETKTPSDFSADGRFLLYASISPKTGRDLWVWPMDGEKKQFVFVNTPFEERLGQFSPDGRWVAYESNESGRFEIYVRPFPPQPSGQWRQVSALGGVSPRWRKDGKELYYIAPDGTLMAVPITVNGPSLEPGTPLALFQTRIVGRGINNFAFRQQYDVAVNGQFLINVTTEDAVNSSITLLLNWKPPAK